MRIALTGMIVFFVVLASASAAPPAAPAGGPPKEPLADQVREAIRKGVTYLRDKERRDGNRSNWEIDVDSVNNEGGWTSLALLALLNSGVPPEDPLIQRGLNYLRTVNPNRTYVVGLQTMVLAQAGFASDRALIQRNVKWIENSLITTGWSYGGEVKFGGDFSNTQYALLGLYEGLRAGAHLDDPSKLQEIQAIYQRWQAQESREWPEKSDWGGWGYRPGSKPLTMTMTAAGLCGLIITGMDLNAPKQKLREDGSAENCGVYKVQQPVAAALKWIGRRFPARLTEEEAAAFGSTYYCLYGLERAGRLSGERYFGGHDWYRVGCEYLVEAQNKVDGSWMNHGNGPAAFDRWPLVSTSFALLFLSKGRTPILVSKFAYGERGSEGWNNKRRDARHLVEFTSQRLFNKKPLGWQIFDVRDEPAGGVDKVRDLAAELLQSPVVYFNGHNLDGWSDRESEVLKEYVANGGFLFIENCCGKVREPNFDRQLRGILAKMFDAPLEPLPPGHAIYDGPFNVPPARFPLEGINQGCKTVVVYSPTALAGYWEAGDDKSERGKLAFELGANVIAYATGLEPPKPRLTQVEVFRGDSEREQIRRGFLKVGQLKHGGDYKPAPRAMRNLMVEARKAGLDVVLATSDVDPRDKNVVDYRFLYMHGRRQFAFAPAELEHLRFTLESGGVLFADACCGSKAFDSSFREFMTALWDKEKLKLEPIPVDDELFSKELNGAALASVKCRREGPDGKRPEATFKDVAPALEGIKRNGRWVVIYSRYDIGCALEKHQSSDCLGYNYESAAALGKAAVLYALKR